MPDSPENSPNLMPTLLAMDFDGVLCDGLIEYFQTSWRAYCQIWLPADHTPPAGLAEQFYRLRPVIETGWEMPVLLRSLLTGISETEILADWSAIAPRVTQMAGLTPAELSAKVDQVRDQWIAADPESWLAQQRFYPGVVERLQQILSSTVYPVIISTKEGRFVQQLLWQQGINLAQSQIFGKEVRQPKAQTLRSLGQQFQQTTSSPVRIWFIEDRLKTLQFVSTQPDLQDVKLFLAAWGYNTESDREIARQTPQIRLLSLTEFAEDFLKWV
jgi:phosphoglycolate phosphatase-like HAD superfamily hydrolase